MFSLCDQSANAYLISDVADSRVRGKVKAEYFSLYGSPLFRQWLKEWVEGMGHLELWSSRLFAWSLRVLVVVSESALRHVVPCISPFRC